jgi:hypothetical protein
MKLVKVTTDVTVKDGVTYRGYPDVYDATRVDVLCYGDEKIDPDEYKYCICLIKDDYLKTLTESKNVVEINEEEAIAFGEKHRPQTDVINNPIKVIEIVKKIVKDEKLTELELEAIDSSKSTSGIVKTPSFTARLQKLIS